MDVYILSGCSGSGKSTEAKLIRDRHAYLDKIGDDWVTICSADHYFLYNRIWELDGNASGTYNFNPALLGRAHGECLRRFIEAVQQEKQLIIVDNTNTTVEEMAPYYAVAGAYEAAVHIYTATTDPIVAHARNKHNVPLHVVQAQAARIAARRLPSHWDVDILWF